jgi:predicted secreted Zn-dependent protease
MDLSRLTWRKSSYSNSNGGGCVEVGLGGPLVVIRDSKNPDGPKLIVSAAEWSAFLAGVKAGNLTLP